MRLRLPLACASLAAAALAPIAARAGGLLVADTGSQGLQRAGAFHAKADDPTALHYNPAGLVRAAHRYELYVGSHVVNFSQTYQRSGTYAPLMDGQPDPAWVGQPYPEASYSGTKPVPMLLATQNFGRFALGEGLVVPSGYPFRRFNDNQDTLPDGRPAPQRYDIMNQDAFVIFPSVGGAVSILPELDVGVRLSWGIGRLDATNQTWGITNDAEHPGNDALFRVEASDSFVPNAGVGLLYRPTPFLELGASYTSASHVRARGTGETRLGSLINNVGGAENWVDPSPLGEGVCSPDAVGTPAALKACVNLDQPQIVAVGGRYIVRDGLGRERADVELDLQWEDWSAASDVTVIVDGADHLTGRRLYESIIRHGMKDVLSARVGGSYRFDVGKNAVYARGGASYDTQAVPDSWQRTDIDGGAHVVAATGASWEMSHLRVDLGFAYVYSPDRTAPMAGAPINTVKDRIQPDPAQALQGPLNTQYHPFNAGTYSSRYLIGTVGVTASW